GILHRDIKPGNIMVTGRGHVKVLDFGLAKQVAADKLDETRTLEALTVAGTLMGTPHYMSPEVLQGKPADARSDLWALGVVLYERRSGRLPFRGPTMIDMSSAILREDPPPLPSTVPYKLKRIVERCLEKEPGGRDQNARRMRAALAVTGTAPAPERKHWLWTGGAAALIAAGVFTWQQVRPLTGVRLTSTGAPASLNQEA